MSVRLYLAVPLAERATAEALLTNATGQSWAGGLSVLLGPSGQPATAYGAEAQVDTATGATISALWAGRYALNYRYARGVVVGEADPGAVLVDVGTVVPDGTPTDSLRFTFARFIADLGMVKTPPPFPFG